MADLFRTSGVWRDGIVPVAVECTRLEMDVCHLAVDDAYAARIPSTVKA